VEHALGWQLFSFSTWNTSCHALLAFEVSIEKSAVILMGVLFYVTWCFSLRTFNILSCSVCVMFQIQYDVWRFFFGAVCLLS
jgi:hypothetical protein